MQATLVIGRGSNAKKYNIDELVKLKEMIIDFFEILKEMFNKACDFIKGLFKEVITVDPKATEPNKRYKLVKELKPSKITLFSNKKHLINCRNNC